HDVVARTRRLAATRKVGHAGTLDPMATGLLVLGVNRATRLLTYLVGADKEYTATVRLGQATVTDDAEGEVTDRAGVRRALDEVALDDALTPLRGVVEQVPSAVSAIKVDGQRSYARVRAGEDVALRARQVTVHELVPTAPARPGTAADGTPVLDVDVRVRCSSGTYVRALARDLGAALGTGGHLVRLRRTSVGPFTLHQARELPDVVAEVRAQQEATDPAPLRLTSMTEATRQAFTERLLTEQETRAVRVGQAVPATGGGTRPVAALAPDGHVVALLADRGERARPVLVLDPA
ncbi:tRNA pseudouridine(55) synthase TruB, partial [Georgenia sp. 10Sc9-8]|nr:tRNA pseudouridine(55) synthase TruB [Georgenia halotolerans]